MVMFRNFVDEELAEVELANGQRVRVPRMVIPEDAKPKSDIQLNVPRTSTPQPRTPARRGGAAQSLFGFYVSQGLNPTAAAGIVGNFMQESGTQLNPTAVGDQGTAFGIGQWRGKRFANLRSFANQLRTDWKDRETQGLFALWEMGYEPLTGLGVQGAGFGSERAAGQRVFNAETVEDAAFAMAGFERPRGWKGFGATDPKNIHGWDNRLKFSQQLASGGTDFAASGGDALDRAPRTMPHGGGTAATTAASSGGTDSIRDRLRSLLSGGARRQSAPIKRSKGQVIGDVITGGLAGLAAGSSGSNIDIPESPFPSPNEASRIFNQQAQSGPLPSLEESAQMQFGQLFGS